MAYCYIKQIKSDLKLLLLQINVPSNPRGAESLPPGIVVSQSDLYLRRLWGEPSEVHDKNSYLLCKKLSVAYRF